LALLEGYDPTDRTDSIFTLRNFRVAPLEKADRMPIRRQPELGVKILVLNLLGAIGRVRTAGVLSSNRDDQARRWRICVPLLTH
jgi:hypothetical protein